MNRKILAIVLFAGLFSGCATTPPVQRPVFPLAEYEALNKVGSGVVKGQAFLTTKGGDVKVGAGKVILLNPVTSYSEHWYIYNYLAQKPLPDSDPRIENYTKRTTADAQGNFTFKNVPAGDYYAVTVIQWQIPTTNQFINAVTGGVVAKKITVKDGETAEVMLTD